MITPEQAYKIGRYAYAAIGLEIQFNEHKRALKLPEDIRVKPDFQIVHFHDGQLIGVDLIITGIDFGSREMLGYFDTESDAEIFITEVREFLSQQWDQK